MLISESLLLLLPSTFYQLLQCKQTLTLTVHCMSIWENIRTAIFGHSSPPTATVGSGMKAASPAAGSAPPASAATPVTATPAPVDIETVMKGYEAKTQQQLNWRTSIVDLLKLLGIDSSLANRTELAKELGYNGSTSDSASMNLWLHKQVLRKLQESGGKVPPSLTV